MIEVMLFAVCKRQLSTRWGMGGARVMLNKLNLVKYMYLVVFYVGEYVCMCGCVCVCTKSKSSELSPLRSKNLQSIARFAILLRNFLLRLRSNQLIATFQLI
jgi:hypothetical protein